MILEDHRAKLSASASAVNSLRQVGGRENAGDYCSVCDEAREKSGKRWGVS